MPNLKKDQKIATKKSKNLILGMVAIVVIAAAAFTFFQPEDVQPNNAELPKATAVSATNANGDLEIPIVDITEKATFYAYDELTNPMEIIAVKASDGTIRTAFNTCQVCYGSGRGYYVQDGDVLVCQNCGNRFKMDEVQVTKGGCNPVPIGESDKVVTDTNITISKELLTQADSIFENWKA